MGVREWLVQEQVRSWLVTIFSRVDPLRLMEVDLVMQVGKVREAASVRTHFVFYMPSKHGQHIV